MTLNPGIKLIKNSLKRTLGLFALFLLSGCSPSGQSPSGAVQISSQSTLPAAKTTFLVSSPPLTSSDASLGVMLLDEVTGAPYNAETVAMEKQADGLWKAEIYITDGALIRYRYILLTPGREAEYSAQGKPIETRYALIRGPSEIHDVIPAWPGNPHQALTGRIVGTLIDSQKGDPLFNQIVAIGGELAFTDAEGGFRIDGLPAGLHHLTAFSPDGAYITVQQDAYIAEGGLTPAELELEPAVPITVTFQVALPREANPNVDVHVVGNVLPLGNLFEEIAGGMRASIHSIPTMVYVDDDHRLLIARLYSGTYLRYKYSLGNGLWNAERSSGGYFITRELVLPEQDLILEDTVQSWEAGTGQISFNVLTPSSTPLQEQIGLQFNPFQWMEPLPMTQISPHQWTFNLYGPSDIGSALSYRYCRSLMCGVADDVETVGPNASGRPVTPSAEPQIINDTVEAWNWWPTDREPTTIVAPDITPRPDFETGLALVPARDPSWAVAVREELSNLKAIGVNTVILSPSWSLDENNPLPILNYHLFSSPTPQVMTGIVEEAHSIGLQVVLKPTLISGQADPATWWLKANRDSDWWVTWHERYRAFAITHANLAQQTNVDALILGDRSVFPAFPGGVLSDGSSAGTPLSTGRFWIDLISEVRSKYAGEIGVELDLAENLQQIPNFISSLDRLHIYWHAPLSEVIDPDFGELRESASIFMNQILAQTAIYPDLPLYISVEYLSIEGTSDACAEAPDMSCRSSSEFDFGQVVDPDIQVDLEEQARAINAILIEAFGRPEIKGFYVSGYNPNVALMDKSASIHGKPAEDVLSYWYPRISAEP